MTAGKMEDWCPEGAIFIHPWVIEALLFFVATKIKLFSYSVVFVLIVVTKLLIDILSIIRRYYRIIPHLIL